MNQQQQRGGTFLGVIIGVVLGLGMALAVAVYVTKVPVPFLTKNLPRKAEQDAAEAIKNKDWDPNAPLRGKTPLRPASAAVSGAVAEPASAPESGPDVAPAKVPVPAKPPVAPVPAPAPVAAPAPAPVAAPAPAPVAVPTPAKPARNVASAPAPAPVAAPVAAPAPAPVAAVPKPRPVASTASGDPLGDLARARSGGATSDPFSYFVQAGAFRAPEDAEAQRAKLSLMGVEARVTEREQSGRTVYRVRVGPFDNKDLADRVKERLDGSGMESAMVRVQR
jgi:outer membrane biosynthesis protein TonB